MKIAVPVTNDNKIDSHFGHCEYFNIYSLSETNEISSVKKLDSANGCGCKSGIATVLSAEGVKVMLAGGIGGGAINVLNQNGIDVVRGCSGSPEEMVKLYISGKLTDSGESCRQHEHHHGNGESHSCNHN